MEVSVGKSSLQRYCLFVVINDIVELHGDFDLRVNCVYRDHYGGGGSLWEKDFSACIHAYMPHAVLLSSTLITSSSHSLLNAKKVYGY